MATRDSKKRAAQNHRYYLKNKQKFADYREKQREGIRDAIDEARSGGCENCDEDHPACLTFHHRDPSEKEFQISDCRNKLYSLKKLAAEIAKCDVLCRNCHAKVHWKDRP